MTSKKWYRRRRYWSLAVLAILVYFCLIPSPLRVSSETTGFTEPLLPNGDVDYFGAYERMYIHKLSPPEDNGQRLLIAALGPKSLEQYSIATTVPWEQIPTDERSKRWFETQWVPLCEHMYIDPYEKPRFLDVPDFYTYMEKEWEVGKEDSELGKKIIELQQQLATAIWTAEDHPEVVRWLEERSPLLDLFGVAVRKPNFVCYRWRPDSEGLYAILLPEVQSNREFGRDLRIRVTERLGRGDVDGAWYDVMSMFYLSRKHYIHDPILVVNLVGLAIEGMGYESAKLILQHENLTPEQLERFAHDLDSLPRKTAVLSEFELFTPYPGLQLVQKTGDIFGGECCRSEPITDLTTFFLHIFGGDDRNAIPRYLTYLPLDRNIAGKRVTEFLQTDMLMFGTSVWNVNSRTMKKYLENFDRRAVEKDNQLKNPLRLWRVPLIRTRSELFADYVIALLAPAVSGAQHAIDRANTRLELLRLSIALERYKLANGEYPETLDALIPKYLLEVPLEPLTGRQSFVYVRSPDAETSFLLHSAKWKEDDGLTKDLFVRFSRLTQ